MTIDAGLLAGIRERVEAGMREHVVPGVVVGILDGGEQAFECFGTTSIDNPLPVDQHTLYQIGSTTKTFAATLLMQEVERGRLGLDAPVRQYLPELQLQREEWTDALTARHLLTHTGGFDGDWYLVHPRGHDERLAAAVAGMPEVPCQVPPGCCGPLRSLPQLAHLCICMFCLASLTSSLFCSSVCS